MCIHIERERAFLRKYWYRPEKLRGVTAKETAIIMEVLTFWRRNFFQILAHPVFKM